MYERITDTNIPCWYEFSFQDGKVPAIIFRLHKDWVKIIQITDQAPIVGLFISDYGFKKFESDFRNGFGFDGATKYLRDYNGFVELEIPIPVTKYSSKEVCEMCDGTGEDELLQRKCMFCGGKKFKTIYNPSPAQAISATLAILTMLLQFPEENTSAATFQLITLKTICQSGLHGGSLGGEYSAQVSEWLVLQRSVRKVDSMVKAMKRTYEFMLSAEKLQTNNFRANVDYDNGWLNVSCPGNACGLNPSTGGVSLGKGYEYSCHNVDGPVQQLTLIAGLGALGDAVRASIDTQTSK